MNDDMNNQYGGLPTTPLQDIPPVSPEPVYGEPVPARETTPPITPPQYTQNTTFNNNYSPQDTGYFQEQYVYSPPGGVKEKSKNGASTAFMVVLWTLLGVFVIGFFILCGYIILNSESRELSPSSPVSTEGAQDDSDLPHQAPVEGGVIPNEDKDNYSDDTVIKLKPLPSDKDNSEKYDTQYAFNSISDSTVGVVCYNGEITSTSTPVSQGTGIVLSSDGYIATNSHVIGDSRSLYKVRVTTNDGTTYEGNIVGYDTRTDLAVIKITAKNLKAATFSDSDLVEIGQDVIAVGNPGGMNFQNSLTKGIISAKDRKLSLSSQVSYLQTDAAINPGNSGGPLCNMQGQVIGINTAKISSDSYEGMGFAIPSQTVKEVVDDLILQGYVEGRVRIGITGQAVTPAMTQYYGIPSGIIVGEIDENGPCGNTTLEINDIITEFDGESISSFADIYSYLAEHKAGDKVTLTVYRLDPEKTFTIDIILQADNGASQE